MKNQSLDTIFGNAFWAFHVLKLKMIKYSIEFTCTDMYVDIFMNKYGTIKEIK